jgi:hypothetical protein
MEYIKRANIIMRNFIMGLYNLAIRKIRSIKIAFLVRSIIILGIVDVRILRLKTMVILSWISFFGVIYVILLTQEQLLCACNCSHDGLTAHFSLSCFHSFYPWHNTSSSLVYGDLCCLCGDLYPNLYCRNFSCFCRVHEHCFIYNQLEWPWNIPRLPVTPPPVTNENAFVQESAFYQNWFQHGRSTGDSSVTSNIRSSLTRNADGLFTNSSTNNIEGTGTNNTAGSSNTN